MVPSESTGVLGVLDGWIRGAQGLAAYAPAAADRIAAGSWPLMAGAAAVALALLVAGSRAARGMAAAGAFGVGYAAGPHAAIQLGIFVAPATAGWVAGSVLAIAAAVWPAAYPAALGAFAGAAVGREFPVGGRTSLGAAVGGGILALVGIALRRVAIATTAAGAGAVLLALVLLSVARRYGVATVFRDRPLVLAALAALLTVGGAAFQLGAPEGGRRRERSPDHVAQR